MFSRLVSIDQYHKPIRTLVYGRDKSATYYQLTKSADPPSTLSTLTAP